MDYTSQATDGGVCLHVVSRKAGERQIAKDRRGREREAEKERYARRSEADRQRTGGRELSGC